MFTNLAILGAPQCRTRVNQPIYDSWDEPPAVEPLQVAQYKALRPKRQTAFIVAPGTGWDLPYRTKTGEQCSKLLSFSIIGSPLLDVYNPQYVGIIINQQGF